MSVSENILLTNFRSMIDVRDNAVEMQKARDITKLLLNAGATLDLSSFKTIFEMEHGSSFLEGLVTNDTDGGGLKDIPHELIAHGYSRCDLHVARWLVNRWPQCYKWIKS